MHVDRILFEWQFNKKLCKKNSRDEETTYGWKQRDAKEKIHPRKKRVDIGTKGKNVFPNQSSENMKVRVFNELEKITDSIYIWIYFALIFVRFETLCQSNEWHSFLLELWMRPIVLNELIFVRWVSVFYSAASVTWFLSHLLTFFPYSFFFWQNGWPSV